MKDLDRTIFDYLCDLIKIKMELNGSSLSDKSKILISNSKFLEIDKIHTGTLDENIPIPAYNDFYKSTIWDNSKGPNKGRNDAILDLNSDNVLFDIHLIYHIVAHRRSRLSIFIDSESIYFGEISHKKPEPDYKSELIEDFLSMDSIYFTLKYGRFERKVQ